jgi:hypothetical protein
MISGKIADLAITKQDERMEFQMDSGDVLISDFFKRIRTNIDIMEK